MIQKQLRRAGLWLCVATLLGSQFILAQQSQPPGQSSPTRFALTVDSIMRGPRLVGYPPSGAYWSQDSQRVYFRWKQSTEPRLKEASLYVVNRNGTGLRRLSDDEARQAPPAAGELSKDKTLTVFTEEGDIFIYDHRQGERRQITHTTDVKTNAHFTADQKKIYFTSQNNLYVITLDGGSLSQLTDIRVRGNEADQTAAGTRGGAGRGAQRQGGGAQGQGQASATGEEQRRGTDSQEYLKKEERQLLEAVRERVEQREEQEAKRKQREKRKPYYLAVGETVGNLALAPDSKHIIATIAEQGVESKSAIVPNYVTESGYTEEIPNRTKVGDTQGRSRLLIIDAETGAVTPVDHGQRQAPAQTPKGPSATEKPASGAEAKGAGPQPTPGPSPTLEQAQREQQAEQQDPQHNQMGRTRQGQPRDRDVQLSQLQWSEDGKNAALMARAADNKDRWVMLLEIATGKTKVLSHIHDDAWVGGPGAFTLGWLPDNDHVYFESERDGFAHLYSVAISGGEPTQLTAGQFEVSDVRLSGDKTKFYFTSSEGSPFERHLYSMPIGGGERTRRTSLSGNNQAEVSPDDMMLANLYSYSNKPPELYLEANNPGLKPVVSSGDKLLSNVSALMRVTDSPIAEFASYKWLDPPIVDFKARDGATVYGRLYKPANWKPGGPAVLFVHGAGYLQNVHRWWSSYYREYMFHHLLMERGFVVLDIDYRGSAGYGRDWRTGIYRHMGGKDLTDHVDAANYLVREHGVDPKRVGLYGGSYGGFITLMALFTQPDVFAAGAALRPVTDWAHYNNGYTSNILNLPQNDPQAYQQSSPIYFANGLQGALLICHGMVDTNVNFQDTVRLVEKLIELRKENWEVAPYPVEDHTFDRDASWADEYKRILKLFMTNLHPETRTPLLKKSSGSKSTPPSLRAKP